MRAQGSGVIINVIHRTATLVTGSARDQSGESAYVASMNGSDGFTRQAARELSPYGIHVYSVENIPEKIVVSVFALLDSQMEER